jgi:hypothetical protein
MFVFKQLFTFLKACCSIVALKSFIVQAAGRTALGNGLGNNVDGNKGLEININAAKGTWLKGIREKGTREESTWYEMPRANGAGKTR